MTSARRVKGPLDDATRRELVYDGELLAFEGVLPIDELRALADDFVREHSGGDDPVVARFRLEKDDSLARVEALQKRFRRSERARALSLAALERVGGQPRADALGLEPPAGPTLG